MTEIKNLYKGDVNLGGDWNIFDFKVIGQIKVILELRIVWKELETLKEDTW